MSVAELTAVISFLAALGIAAGLIAYGLNRRHEAKLRFWRERAQRTHDYYDNMRRVTGKV